MLVHKRLSTAQKYSNGPIIRIIDRGCKTFYISGVSSLTKIEIMDDEGWIKDTSSVTVGELMERSKQ